MGAFEISVRIEGLGALSKSLERLSAGAEKALRSGLREEAEEVAGRAKREFVPVKTGALKGTIHAFGPEADGDSGVAAGGPAAPYAVIQHERLDFHHTVGQAKYLEQPAQEATRGMPQRLAEKVEREMRKEAG